MKITRGKVMLFDRLKDQLKQHVKEVYEDYARAYPEHAGWGVESWNIYGSNLSLTLCWSRRGCVNHDSVNIPVAWMYMSEAERKEEVVRIKAETKIKEDAEQAALEKARLAAELAEFKRLKEKFG